MIRTTLSNALRTFRYNRKKLRGKKHHLITAENSPEFDTVGSSTLNLTETKLTASTIARILAAADEGNSAEQAALLQAVLEKEPVITAHLQTRQLAVLACGWKIAPAPEHNSEKNQRQARELKKILDRAEIYRLMKHLLDALCTGYSGSALIWEKGGASISRIKHIHPANWTFDRRGKPSIITENAIPVPLEEYHPNQFVFHTQQIKPGLPCRGGLLRTLLWLYFFKHYALKDKARYLERFGIPFMLAKIRRDDFDDDENRLRILNSMSKMGSDGVGIVTENSDVQVLNGISGGNPEAFRNWFSYIDDIFALTILGQTASSKNASGMSRGQIQENVRRDLLEADAHNLENTVNRQIMVPLEKFRYGTEGQFRFHIEYQKKENLKDKAEIVRTVAESVKIFRECGYSIDHEKIAGIFEIPELVMRKDKGRE